MSIKPEISEIAATIEEYTDKSKYTLKPTYMPNVRRGTVRIAVF